MKPPTSPEPSGVLLIGNDFQSLGVIRALRHTGIPLFLVQHERGIAGTSRFVTRRRRNFRLISADDGADWLIRLAQEESLSGWTIFCVDDDTVEFLARNHTVLSQHFVVSVPPWQTTQTFFEKDRSSRLAASVGIDVPAEYPSDSLDELLAADIVYPVVLKPTFKKNYYGKTNDKALLAQDERTLIREYNSMNALIDSSQILVQDFLPGGPKNLYSFATIFDGENVVEGLSAHRLRQHPMDFGHATTFAISVDLPILEDLATRFLRALGYRGVAEVEFMYDERTATYKFIEMNGRFWGWHGLTFAAGLNFPRSLHQTLNGKPPERTPARIGATWVRTLTDTPTMMREILGGRMPLKMLAARCFTRAHDAVWTSNDPTPFLVECGIAPYLWWKKGF